MSGRLSIAKRPRVGCRPLPPRAKRSRPPSTRCRLRSSPLARVLLALLSLVFACAALPALAVPQRVTDTIPKPTGRGPYVLGWRGILSGSESVSLGTTILRRGRDYSLDPASGLLALSQPPVGETSLVISYDIEPGVSQSNQRQPSSAVVRLLDRGPSSVRAQVYFRQAATANAMSPVSAVAVGADTERQGLKLSSLLLVGTDAGAFSARTGVRLGAGYQSGGLQLSADYARAGDQMSTVDGLGLKAGQELLALQGAYRISPKLGVASSFRSTESEAGVRQSVQSYSAEYQPIASTSLTAQRQVTQTSGGLGDTVTTNSLVVKSSPAQGLGLQAGFARTSSGQRGDSSLVTGQVDAQRGPVKLQSRVSHEWSKQNAVTGTETRVEAAPTAALKLNAGLNARFSEAARETGVSAGIGLTPTKTVQVSADIAQRRVEDKASDQLHAETAAQVKVAAGTDRVRVLGGYATKQTDESVQNQADAGLQLNPIKPVTLSAGVSQVMAGSEATLTHQAQLQVKPLEGIALAAGYQQSLGQQNVGMQTYSAEVAPFGIASATGLYKHRVDPAGRGLDTLDARLTVRPLSQLQIIGAYSRNPEEKGAIFEAVRRSLGLQTQAGFLTLSGSYGLEDRLAGESSVMTELGLGVRFSRVAELRAAYKLSDVIGPTAVADSRYSLSYSHNLGSAFSLALEGEAANRRLPAEDLRTDYRGSAKLQMRF